MVDYLKNVLSAYRRQGYGDQYALNTFCDFVFISSIRVHQLDSKLFGRERAVFEPRFTYHKRFKWGRNKYVLVTCILNISFQQKCIQLLSYFSFKYTSNCRQFRQLVQTGPLRLESLIAKQQNRVKTAWAERNWNKKLSSVWFWKLLYLGLWIFKKM